MKRFASLLVAVAGLSATRLGCASAGVERLNVQPPVVCRGQSVEVSWIVRGDAAVTATPTPANWTNGRVDSVDSRTVVIDRDTTFRVEALEANEAKPRKFGEKPARVVTPTMDKRASASCDPTKKAFRGQFTLRACSARARQISTPVAVRSGHRQPRRVCVSHLGKETCIAPGETKSIDVPLSGQWVLTTELAPEESCYPPMQLGVTLAVDCS